jgi:hypothetical protein
MLYGKKHYKEQNVLKITSVGAYFVFGLKGVDIYDSLQYNNYEIITEKDVDQTKLVSWVYATLFPDPCEALSNILFLKNQLPS